MSLPPMSPYDEVRAQLGRQKWAVDTRDSGALPGIYAADCTLILKADGVEEFARIQGRQAIIDYMVAGWAASATAWRPGSMIHHIGAPLIEPAHGGMIACRSYATYVHLTPDGATEMRGYGKYHDLWVAEDDAWRLHEREVHIFGLTLGKGRG